jgi:hypothetical protein
MMFVSSLYLRSHSASTVSEISVKSQYTAAMSHGMPSPRNTFTALDPVTLPTAASALSSPRAAALEAKVSGREVPRATKVMAVMLSARPMEHPKSAARSPMNPVTRPMNVRAVTKHGQPPPQDAGGMAAKKSFQGSVMPCMT